MELDYSVASKSISSLPPYILSSTQNHTIILGKLHWLLHALITTRNYICNLLLGLR